MSKSIKVVSFVVVFFAVAFPMLWVSASNAQPFAVTAVVDNGGGLRGSGALTFLLPTFVQSLFAKNMSDCCVDVEIQGHSPFAAVGSLLEGSFKVPSYQSYFFKAGPWETFKERFEGVPIGQLLTIKANWSRPVNIYGLIDPTVCPSDLYLSFFLSQ